MGRHLISNVFPVDELSALARRKRGLNVAKSVPSEQLESYIANGWKQAGRKKKASVRISKPKPPHIQLEDRVWTSLFRMGFTHLSGDRGSTIPVDPKDPGGPTNQIDVFAMDDDVALAVECKSLTEPRKEPRFQEELAKVATLREPLARAVAAQFPSEEKRRIVLALFTSNLLLTDNDKSRAENLNVALFDDSDLSYYEALTQQLGPAARYQFLCDLIPGKPVPHLGLTVPAIRTRMGKYECFLFSVHPEYLLKICYVSHRAKGKASDIDAYQRMVSKARLSRIRTYIADGGVFPTNIVLSFQDPERLRFERGRQDEDSTDSTSGWLHISPTYKEAWIIDGQHRLFAYSGQAGASRDRLSVLAFSGLPSNVQAELFIDINGEQRRVKKNLLQDLYAELHWSSADPRDRIAAIISKAIQQLDETPDSPFFGRILRADESKSPARCISLTTLFRALDKPGYYVAKAKHGAITEYGPFWSVDNDATLRRTRAVLDAWFGRIKELNPDWWSQGSGPGGGLAMNDGVTICVNCLRSVLTSYRSMGGQLDDLSDKELIEFLDQYALALAEHLRGLDPQSREKFRQLRGAQGQSRGTFTCLAGMKSRVASFSPDGLEEFQKREAARTTEQARGLIDKVETRLQQIVLQELREEFEGERWWYDGVPASVRQKVALRKEEDQGKRGGNEAYFDLLDYRAIAAHNWVLFADILGYGKGSKEKRTDWINRVNEVRRRVMHPSSGGSASFEEIQELQLYADWLHGIQSQQEPEPEA